VKIINSLYSEVTITHRFIYKHQYFSEYYFERLHFIIFLKILLNDLKITITIDNLKDLRIQKQLTFYCNC